MATQHREAARPDHASESATARDANAVASQELSSGPGLAGPCSCGAPPPIARRSILGGQRALGNQVMQRWLDEHRRLHPGQSRPPLAHAATPLPRSVQRQPLQRKPENEAPLAAIQGYAMFGLLPALAALPPEVRTDEAAGGFVGGPRLVTAMRAVAAKGTPWMSFVAARNGELASLPNDQISDIITFLGAPKDARYYKADQFSGWFDGGVDPAAGTVTLYFRVRFVVEGARFGPSSAGSKEWEEETRAGLEKFKVDFKRVVEETWSGKGSLKPACAVGSVKSLKATCVVTVVDSGEHTVFKILNDGPDARAHAKPGEGSLKTTSNMPVTEAQKGVIDPTGKKQVELTTTRTGSAHEFGHAIGLHHPRPQAGDEASYGKTAEERSDVMGAGQKLQKIKIGGHTHNDFEPWERIAKRWGQDVFPGALAKCNEWSPG
jgi:hypothetical protein